MTNCEIRANLRQIYGFYDQFRPFWTDHKSDSALPQHHFFYFPVKIYDITHRYSKTILIFVDFHSEKRPEILNWTYSILIWSQFAIPSISHYSFKPQKSKRRKSEKSISVFKRFAKKEIQRVSFLTFERFFMGVQITLLDCLGFLSMRFYI